MFPVKFKMLTSLQVVICDISVYRCSFVTIQMRIPNRAFPQLYPVHMNL